MLKAIARDAIREATGLWAYVLVRGADEVEATARQSAEDNGIDVVKFKRVAFGQETRDGQNPIS